MTDLAEGSLGRANWGLSQWIEHEEIQNGKGLRAKCISEGPEVEVGVAIKTLVFVRQGYSLGLGWQNKCCNNIMSVSTILKRSGLHTNI